MYLYAATRCTGVIFILRQITIRKLADSEIEIGTLIPWPYIQYPIIIYGMKGQQYAVIAKKISLLM